MRKLAELRSYATTTLQPCKETYGLTPTTLSAVSDQGTPVTFQLANLSTAPELTPQPPPSYNTTEKVLFLLDQYGSFYHELAQVNIYIYISISLCTKYGLHLLYIGCSGVTQIPPCKDRS